jgi:hypothetical protein
MDSNLSFCFTNIEMIDHDHHKMNKYSIDILAILNLLQFILPFGTSPMKNVDYSKMNSYTTSISNQEFDEYLSRISNDLLFLEYKTLLRICESHIRMKCNYDSNKLLLSQIIESFAAWKKSVVDIQQNYYDIYIHHAPTIITPYYNILVATYHRLIRCGYNVYFKHSSVQSIPLKFYENPVLNQNSSKKAIQLKSREIMMKSKVILLYITRDYQLSESTLQDLQYILSLRPIIPILAITPDGDIKSWISHPSLIELYPVNDVKRNKYFKSYCIDISDANNILTWDMPPSLDYRKTEQILLSLFQKLGNLREILRCIRCLPSYSSSIEFGIEKTMSFDKQ